MKKLFTLICLLLTIHTLSAQIIPQPSSEKRTGGTFTITDKSCLVYNSSVRDAAMYLLEYLPFKQILSSQKVMDGDIELNINHFLAPEGYRLTIDNKNIRIIGGSYAGVFNGIQTLLQLLPEEIYTKKTKQRISRKL